MFRDNYTDFSFNELDSKNFKVWITNKNDLKQNMSPNFSDKFNTPTYGQTRYYEGTTIDKQDFKLSCVAIDVTLNEWRAITEWLSPLKCGKLKFDWNRNYYYMVKISSSLSGTIFIKSKVDSIIGDLYIITFDINFTTVEDWAAIGPYCEQNYLEDINSNVYNNDYYLPEIILRDSYIDGYDTSKNNIIPSADKILVSFKTTNLSGNQILGIMSYSGETVGIIKESTENGIENIIYEYYYNKELVWSKNLPYKKDKSNYEFYFNSNPGYYLQWMSTDYNATIERYNDSNILITNTGAFNAYPIFYVKDSCTISKDSKTYYSFTKSINNNMNYQVKINSKTSNITQNGVIIDNSKDKFGIPLYELKIENSGQLYIKSGRPELFKAILVKDKVIDYTNSIRRCAEFLLNSKPIYDRDKKIILHSFSEDFKEATNKFNIDRYNDNSYYSNLLNYKRLLLNNPDIEYIETEEGWKMRVYYNIQVAGSYTQEDGVTKENGYDFRYNDNSKYSNSIGFKEVINSSLDDNIYRVIYISICDYTELNVECDNNDFSVGLNTRGVM